MSNRIIVKNNKILRLNNVIIKSISEEELNLLPQKVDQMNDYIKSKGSIPIGPLIQYVGGKKEAEEDYKSDIKIMRQANNYINNMDLQYKIQSILKVKNCLYVRFTGKEEELHYAYSKISITAYEENIKLKGDNYTVYLDKDDNNIVADIFMEKEENE